MGCREHGCPGLCRGSESPAHRREDSTSHAGLLCSLYLALGLNFQPGIDHLPWLYVRFENEAHI